MKALPGLGHQARRHGRFAVGVLTGTLALTLSSPASALYKCVASGKTTFQEQECPAGEKQTVIRSQYEPQATDAAPPPTVPVPSAVSTSDQDKLANMEAERLRRDAAYALRDKLAQYNNQQAACERSFGVVFSRAGTGTTRSVTGAVYQQSIYADANAGAVRCIARTNELQQEVGNLRQQCAARNCE
ncbi:hypothetical protein BH11PSE13_BH11PSE13_15740 [soil metagenome]